MTKTAIVPIGPRGAGKTTYCKKTVLADSGTSLVVRDEIALARFGKTSFDQNTEFYEDMFVGALFWNATRVEIQKNNIVILDTWSSDERDRKIIIKSAKQIGFHRVICWYFTTPPQQVFNWYRQKKDIKLVNCSEDLYRLLVYQRYHKNASGIYTDGFDEVIEINPCTCLV